MVFCSPISAISISIASPKAYFRNGIILLIWQTHDKNKFWQKVFDIILLDITVFK